jgi:hypothetical protein
MDSNLLFRLDKKNKLILITKNYTKSLSYIFILQNEYDKRRLKNCYYRRVKFGSIILQKICFNREYIQRLIRKKKIILIK